MPDHLVITNGTEPVAIAGVMGGANSEVKAIQQPSLLNQLISMVQLSVNIKRHGLRSEASARFEKGVDPDSCSCSS